MLQVARDIAQTRNHLKNDNHFFKSPKQEMATQQEINLVQQYCSLATDQPLNPPRGENAPRQDTVAKMENNAVELVLDGVQFFSKIVKEIALLKSTESKYRPFIYCCFWGLDMVKFGPEIVELSSSKDVADGFNWIERQYISYKYSFIPIPGDYLVAAKGSKRMFNYEPDGERTSPNIQIKNLFDEIVVAKDYGIDVRMMGWVNPLNLKFEMVGENAHRKYNLQTAYTVNKLREVLGDDHVFMNVLGHPIGGCHSKFFVVGSDRYLRAYVGGLDPLGGREDGSWRGNGWHDLAVAVEGPAAAGVCKHFTDQWNELALCMDPVKIHYYPKGSGTILKQTIVSHTKSTTATLEEKTAKTPLNPLPIDSFVQVLRTVPQMNMATDLDVPRINGYIDLVPDMFLNGKDQARAYLQIHSNMILDKSNILLRRVLKFDRIPLYFAQDGIFEFKVAARKAIAAATDYLFWADQAFWSEEIFGWIFDRMVQAPNLKVIFLSGDKMAPDTAYAITKCLRTRVINYANLVFWCWTNRVVHPKTILIDDRWAFVGSQNHANRSMYTDFELGLSVCSLTSVQRMRKQLWDFYKDTDSSLTAPMPTPTTLQEALNMWNPLWGRTVALLPKAFVRQPIPPLPGLAAQCDALLAMVKDADARDNW
jgi:phosphatidylserine/phosphatidylglycerophosphate/cardiolipin synthase-like enzyme